MRKVRYNCAIYSSGLWKQFDVPHQCQCPELGFISSSVFCMLLLVIFRHLFSNNSAEWDKIRQDNGSQVSSLAFLVTEWADTEIWANTAQPSGCKHHVTDTLSTELTRNLKQANGHGQNMSRGDRKWPACDSGRTGWNACHENGELRSHYVYNNHSDFSGFSCFFKTISILVC